MIRKATKEDAAQVIPLLRDAIDTIAYALSGTEDDAETNSILASFFKRKGNRISYENTIVDERDGRIAGMLVAYHGCDAESLDRPLIERIRQTGKEAAIAKEAGLDEYYLDSLAVDTEFQGQGIAKGLMAAFEREATVNDYPKISLIVEANNERAHALYSRMGYREKETLQLYGHRYTKMTKKPEGSAEF